MLGAMLVASILMGHIPSEWCRVGVVFIPKGGRNCDTTPKDFKPITMSSFLLKTMERLGVVNLCQTHRNLLSRGQHAYNKGRSFLAALNSLMCRIEKSLA